MELPEPIEVLNQRLQDNYGRFENGQPIWRIVFSEDQYEHRFGTFRKFDNSGNYLGEVTGFEYVPKYKQWLPQQYVLERLMPVPELNRKELTTALSYEPVWGFHDKHGKPLPPIWEATVLIIETVLKKAAETVKAPYKDPKILESDPKIARDVRRAKIDKLVEQLFGNETDTTDAMMTKEAIVVPTSYNKTGESNA